MIKLGRYNHTNPANQRSNVYFFKKEWVMNKFGYEWSQFICVFIDAQNYNENQIKPTWGMNIPNWLSKENRWSKFGAVLSNLQVCYDL